MTPEQIKIAIHHIERTRSAVRRKYGSMGEAICAAVLDALQTRGFSLTGPQLAKAVHDEMLAKRSQWEADFGELGFSAIAGAAECIYWIGFALNNGEHPK